MKIDGVYYIDLDGPEGNAFCLGGIARDWASQLGDTPLPVLTDGAQSYREVLDRFDAMFKDRVQYVLLHDPRNPSEEDDD